MPDLSLNPLAGSSSGEVERPRLHVELVCGVVDVIDGDRHHFLVAVVVGPVDGTGGDCDDVSTTEAVYFLVRVLLSFLSLSAHTADPFLLLLLSSYSGVECLGTSREVYSDNPFTFFDEDESREWVEARKCKRVWLYGLPHRSDSDALELVIINIPCFDGATFELKALSRLGGGESLEVAELRAAEAWGACGG